LKADTCSDILKVHSDEIEQIKNEKKEDKNLLTIPQGGWDDPNKMSDDDLLNMVMDKVELRVNREVKILDNEI